MSGGEINTEDDLKIIRMIRPNNVIDLTEDDVMEGGDECVAVWVSNTIGTSKVSEPNGRMLCNTPSQAEKRPFQPEQTNDKIQFSTFQDRTPLKLSEYNDVGCKNDDSEDSIIVKSICMPRKKHKFDISPFTIKRLSARSDILNVNKILPNSNATFDEILASVLSTKREQEDDVIIIDDFNEQSQGNQKVGGISETNKTAYISKQIENEKNNDQLANNEPSDYSSIINCEDLEMTSQLNRKIQRQGAEEITELSLMSDNLNAVNQINKFQTEQNPMTTDMPISQASAPQGSTCPTNVKIQNVVKENSENTFGRFQTTDNSNRSKTIDETQVRSDQDNNPFEIPVGQNVNTNGRVGSTEMGIKNGNFRVNSYLQNLRSQDRSNGNDNSRNRQRPEVCAWIYPPQFLRRLRPIVVDGNNVARAHGEPRQLYSCRGIQLCVDYFRQRGHEEITVFVPRYVTSCRPPVPVADIDVVHALYARGHVAFTPSRRLDGRLVASYDDRFVLELACRTGAVVVSNDNFRDLTRECAAWQHAVRHRLLMFCMVGDNFLPPQDPLGPQGPTLDEFLSFSPFEQ